MSTEIRTAKIGDFIAIVEITPLQSDGTWRRGVMTVVDISEPARILGDWDEAGIVDAKYQRDYRNYETTEGIWLDMMSIAFDITELEGSK